MVYDSTLIEQGKFYLIFMYYLKVVEGNDLGIYCRINADQQAIRFNYIIMTQYTIMLTDESIKD